MSEALPNDPLPHLNSVLPRPERDPSVALVHHAGLAGHYGDPGVVVHDAVPADAVGIGGLPGALG